TSADKIAGGAERGMGNSFGHFSGDGTEFIITNPRTPRAFDNFLWNDALFANVQQTGVGYSDYQVGNLEAVQLLTGVGRICDFDVFGRDHLMSRLFYVRDQASGDYWTVNGEPVWHASESFECRHGFGYTVITSIANGIESRLRIFVPPGKDPVELWTLTLINRSARPRRLSVFSYNQLQFKFKWGFDSYGDMIFRSSVFFPEHNAVVASKHPHRRPHDFLNGFLTADAPFAAFDGTRDAFVGLYHTLQNPEAVVRGYCSNTPGSADATICAAQFNVELAPNASAEINLILGATDHPANIAGFQKKYFGQFEKYFAELKAANTAKLALNRVQTPDAHFDRMLNGWIKQATHYGATWCRWGWNGYRDLVQHGLGVVTFAPERTRQILSEALRHQFQSGLALRGWNPVDEKPYSDSALWLVFTLIAYLKETGDYAFLDESVPFYDGGSGTVRQHIDRALDFLESNKGAHGLVLIKFGDWNDSLTAVGREGRGESVWLSEAYAEAMTQMAELAAALGDATGQANYLSRHEQIKNAINREAWDGGWFVRCFDDQGEPVGSHRNREGQIFIEAQAWALIAGIADESRRQQLLRSCDEKLLTDLGYALLAPTFSEPDDRIGRISCLEPGTCENGTIYSHTNIWMILGLLKCGQPDKAYDLLRRILPGYYSGKPDDPKRECLPYVLANCYFGPDHRNNRFQMEFSWITGSVAWFNHVLLQHLLGARAEFGGLRIDPRLPADWKECRVERRYRGATYRITIRNPHGLTSGRVELTLDGQLVPGNQLPMPVGNRTHAVIATLVS
ncbi:MAG: GH36-type glycosyl hydrolase domain-containing protein, partial [Verrucomicrobiota bacterium]